MSYHNFCQRCSGLGSGLFYRIENYWKKPSHFVLGETVFRRNHIIADLFARIDFGGKMETGSVLWKQK